MARRPARGSTPRAAPRPGHRLAASNKPGRPTGGAGGSTRFLLVGLLALALFAQTARSLDRLRASRALWRVQILSRAAVTAGRASRELFASNLQALRRAGELDPLEVGIPVVRGAQHLLLGSAGAAEEAYIEALHLEPRPEIYLNLGRAQLLAGNREAARRSFATAVTLDPNLAANVPSAAK